MCFSSWMLQGRNIKHATHNHKKISIKVIASLCVNLYRNDKCPDNKAIQRIFFKEFYFSLSIHEYYSPMNKFDVYILAYSESINVVPLESKWFVPQNLLHVNILPPLVETKLRRKKRKYVKGVDETLKTKTRNKCLLCKRLGHKRTTCNNNKP
ncbi:hypothetical protein H5410_056371 [Solanum commersonii]|uniref:Uncharacterized protein n=1 Tax=Solanum commersonii TaxID=4109 RepID=A0A9J5WLI7_SOLCO|nr:hypothetical protein H5410_056371 [Solanum commersonii]